MNLSFSYNLITRTINWLYRHRFINLLLVVVYIIFIFAAHDLFVNLSVFVMNNLSLDVYNRVVQIIIVFLTFSLLLLVGLLLKKQQQNLKWKLFFITTTLILTVVHILLMFEMQIEVIHMFQFGILAFLMFPFTARFGAAVILTLPVMLVDEWFQYKVLYPHYIPYYEFNDIVLDIRGCGFMMVILWIFGVKNQLGIKPFFKRSEFWVLTTIMICAVIAISTCFISIYTATQCENTWLVLNMIEDPFPFWHTHYFGAVYHIMKPIEGLIAIFLLCLFYMGMDNAAKDQKTAI